MTENHGSSFPGRYALPAGILASLVVLIYILNPAGEPDLTRLFEDSRPVRKVSLQGIFGWKNLDFTVTPEEEDRVFRLVTLSREVRHKVDGVIRFDRLAVRDSLEEILEEDPDFFYTEQLLGTWYRRNGFDERADEYFRRALQHAPVILVIRHVDEDGRPLEGLSLSHVSIECNRVENRSLDPSLELDFPSLETDDGGCIYLPVYDTVLRRTSISFPHGYQVEHGSPGHFEIRGRVGRLADALCRRNGQPLTEPWDTPSQQPIQSAGAVFNQGRLVRVEAISSALTPGFWIRPDGSPFEAASSWNRRMSGKILGMVVHYSGFDGAVDFGIKFSSPELEQEFSSRFSASGMESGSEIGPDRVFFWWGAAGTVSESDRRFLESLNGRLQLLIKAGRGPLENMGSIDVETPEPLLVEEGEFQLESIREIRSAYKSGLQFFGIPFGPQTTVPGLTLVDVAFTYPADYEIIVRAQSAGGDLSLIPSSVGMGQLSSRDRRFHGHLHMDRTLIRSILIQRRPVESMAVGNIHLIPDESGGADSSD
jgi:hypothetical protein